MPQRPQNLSIIELTNYINLGLSYKGLAVMLHCFNWTASDFLVHSIDLMGKDVNLSLVDIASYLAFWIHVTNKLISSKKRVINA